MNKNVLNELSINHYCLLIDQSVLKLLKKEINRVQTKKTTTPNKWIIPILVQESNSVVKIKHSKVQQFTCKSLLFLSVSGGRCVVFFALTMASHRKEISLNLHTNKSKLHICHSTSDCWCRSRCECLCPHGPACSAQGSRLFKEVSVFPTSTRAMPDRIRSSQSTVLSNPNTSHNLTDAFIQRILSKRPHCSLNLLCIVAGVQFVLLSSCCTQWSWGWAAVHLGSLGRWKEEAVCFCSLLGFPSSALSQWEITILPQSLTFGLDTVCSESKNSSQSKLWDNKICKITNYFPKTNCNIFLIQTLCSKRLLFFA